MGEAKRRRAEATRSRDDRMVAITPYLSMRQHCFTYRTWEHPHAALIRDHVDLEQMNQYPHDKSAHSGPLSRWAIEVRSAPNREIFFMSK
jgi:hypothetical protein